MHYFMARQPIFDRDLSVYAYELLFRNNSNQNAFPDQAEGPAPSVGDYDLADQATSKVLINSYLVTDFEAFSSGKKVFVNFTKHLLLEESPTLFPPKTLVVELLETIDPDEPLLEACRALKKKGYLLALDDYVHERDAGNPLLDLVDILKVDFIDNEAEDIIRILRHFQDKPLKLLAEKVETADMFQFAKKAGFHYFQGYFFSKPLIVSGKNLHSNDKSNLLILNELYQENPSFEILSKIIESDLSLSYKLLRLVNSAAFYKPQAIKSIKQATVMLGIKKLKKWILLLMLVDAGKNHPMEILRTSIIRGHMGEQIAGHTAYREAASEIFLMGLFSMIGLIMNAPLEDLLKDLPLSDMVKDALRGVPNDYRKIYDLVLQYEAGAFDKARVLAGELDLPIGTLPAYYKQSIFIAEEIVRSQE